MMWELSKRDRETETTLEMMKSKGYFNFKKRFDTFDMWTLMD